MTRRDTQGRRSKEDGLRWAWRVSLGLFVLAGLTGAFYRFGLVYGWTAGLQLVNIRHAHSHLMYFGWVTPALFALIGLHVSSVGARPFRERLRWILGATLAAALASYPLFLLFGYTPVALGEKRLPLAVMSSTLNMVAWGGFLVFYRRTTRGLPRSRSLLLWDLALTFLVLAMLGAMGLAFLKPMGIEDPVWSSALTHVFLDLFSEGWFVLGVLGLAYAAVENPDRPGGRVGIYLLCMGLPLTFALGMPESLTPPGLKALARMGGALVGTGLLLNVRVLWSEGLDGWRERVPLALLAIKAAGQLTVSLLPGVWWGSLHGARILYLHLMLLGFVSLGLVAAARRAWGRAAAGYAAALYAAVLVLLLSLLPLTSFWPASWRGAWGLTAAAWVAPLPVLAAVLMLLAGRQRGRTAPFSPVTEAK